jgi:Domain of unknown function (DUF4352)
MTPASTCFHRSHLDYEATLTDQDTTSAPVAAPVAPAAPAKTPNKIGLVALILAGVAFLLAVIPATSFIAWVPAVAAIIVGIVGLTRKGQKKGSSITAISIGVVAWIIAIVVATATALSAVGTAIEESDAAPTSAAPADAEPADAAGEEDEPAAEEAGIGTAVTSDSGVTYTVSAMECGLTTAGEEFLSETPAGQFCEVRATVANGGSESMNLSTANVKGYINGASYEANGTVSKFGADLFATDINPGLSVDTVLYFDVPADSTLELVEFSEIFSLDKSVVIRVG